MACTMDPIISDDMNMLGMPFVSPMVCPVDPIRSEPIRSDAMSVLGMPSAQESNLCSSSPSDDAESVCTMDMSTNDDVCSDFSVEDEDSCSDEEEELSLEGTQFSSEQTLLIFDWDDTILPSTWISRQGLRLDAASIVTDEQKEQLSSMAECAIRTLRVAKRYGKVVLVTNAEQGWIELSCKKFMPSLCPVLENIKIQSARALYEKPGVTQPSVWKSFAFRHEIQDFYKTADPQWSKNIISFGDAMHERLAVFNVTNDMSNCYTKSFKFMEQPHLEQLRKEHELIYWCLRHIVSHAGTLDLQVSIA